MPSFLATHPEKSTRVDRVIYAAWHPTKGKFRLRCLPDCSIGNEVNHAAFEEILWLLSLIVDRPENNHAGQVVVDKLYSPRLPAFVSGPLY